MKNCDMCELDVCSDTIKILMRGGPADTIFVRGIRREMVEMIAEMDEVSVADRLELLRWLASGTSSVLFFGIGTTKTSAS